MENLAKKGLEKSGKQIDWTNKHQIKFHIYYTHDNEHLSVEIQTVLVNIFGQVFFPTEESTIDAEKQLVKNV